jgi:hypothetical protein
MIHLHPIPDVKHNCPYCAVRLKARGWHIPGMRNLANLICPQCQVEFYGDLPSGHGLYYPMLLESKTGLVHDNYSINWFADWLRDSYINRLNSPVEFISENIKHLNRPILLNCLDRLYGHCVLKLLNAQYYLDHCQDFSLIILIPKLLRWMVPDGVAEIWTVDLPLKRSMEWNDFIASEIKRRIDLFDSCHLSLAYSHPHPEDFSIDDFTRVRPFPIEKWRAQLKRPVVTFIWREDRNWCDTSQHKSKLDILYRFKQRKSKSNIPQFGIKKQKQNIISLAEKLRSTYPKINFGIAGLGVPKGMPDWISDLRTLEINESTERVWCERYAKSHVVIGVHGSNMLLPSAHAGAVIDLVPEVKRENFAQDIIVSEKDSRMAICRYNFLPLGASPASVANTTVSLLKYLPKAIIGFSRLWCDHKSIQGNPYIVADKRREINKKK